MAISSTNGGAKNSSTEERALQLLATGLEVQVVANALGVDRSRISQIVSDPEFASQLQELKFQNLQKHNERDNSYDAIEDKLLEKLDKSLPFLMKPGEILGAIRVVNAAKRRGISSPDQVVATQQVVQINMPVQLVQKFTTNIHNQVVSAGQQDLITIGAKSLDTLAAGMLAAEKSKSLGVSNGTGNNSTQEVSDIDI